MTFRSINSIDLVIGTHHRQGTGILNGYFKTLEINFPERSFTYYRVNIVPVCFLVIYSEMFDRSAYTIGLNTFDHSCCHTSGNQRIFGVIFKVPASKRITMDI